LGRAKRNAYRRAESARTASKVRAAAASAAVWAATWGPEPGAGAVVAKPDDAAPWAQADAERRTTAAARARPDGLENRNGMGLGRVG
jgi:hypothetical protein